MKFIAHNRFVAALAMLCPMLVATTATAANGLTSFSLMNPGSSNSAAPSPSAQGQDALDGIAAVVNSDVILKSQLAARVGQARAQGNSNVPPDILRSRVLDRMIMFRLQIQRAHKYGMKVSDTELEQGMRRVARNNGLSLSDFERQAQQRGMSLNAVKKRIRNQMLIAKLRRQAVMSKITITPNDVDQYLQTQDLQTGNQPQYRFRDIEIPVGQNAKRARKRLASARKRISGGDNFREVTRQFLQDNDDAQGGLVDWRSAANLPKQFAGVLAGLSTGELSDIVQRGSTLYLFQLVGQRSGGAQTSGNSRVKEIKAQHIVLKPNAIRDRQQTAKRARSVVEQLNAGADFASLAKQYSDDDATADDGGNLGWIPLSQVAPQTRQALAGLSPGGVTPVLNTDQGYEIVKLDKRRQRDEGEQKRRDSARQALGEKRATEQGALWLRKLRDDAYVDIRIKNYHPRSG